MAARHPTSQPANQPANPPHQLRSQRRRALYRRSAIGERWEWAQVACRRGEARKALPGCLSSSGLSGGMPRGAAGRDVEGNRRNPPCRLQKSLSLVSPRLLACSPLPALTLLVRSGLLESSGWVGLEGRKKVGDGSMGDYRVLPIGDYPVQSSPVQIRHRP